MDQVLCMICNNPCEFNVINSCDHCDCCFECYIRKRYCYHQNVCYCCQDEFKSDPIVYQGSIIPYQNLISQNPQHNDDYHFFFFEPQVIDLLHSLLSFHCSKCESTFQTYEQFNAHLNTHNLQVCSICWEANRFLPSLVPVISQKKVDQDNHFQHHSQCIACHKIFFDIHDLAIHMSENHIRCELCLKKDKVTWLKDQKALNHHYLNRHYVCNHPNCCDGDIVAFATSEELVEHYQFLHNQQINFEYDDYMEEEISEERREQKAQELNDRFLQKLETVLEGDVEKIKTLKSSAKNYLHSKISSQEFFRRFISICGEKRQILFTDMVAFLPDWKKRIELLKLNNYPIEYWFPPQNPDEPRPTQGKKKKGKKNCSFKFRVK